MLIWGPILFVYNYYTDPDIKTRQD